MVNSLISLMPEARIHLVSGVALWFNIPKSFMLVRKGHQVQGGDDQPDAYFI